MSELAMVCAVSALVFNVLVTGVALFWQTGKGGRWQVICCLRRPQLIHHVDFFVYLYNVVV